MVEKTRVPGETIDRAQVIEKLYHIMLYRNFILFQNIANLNHINQGHYKIYNKLLLTFVGCI